MILQLRHQFQLTGAPPRAKQLPTHPHTQRAPFVLALLAADTNASLDASLHYHALPNTSDMCLGALELILSIIWDFLLQERVATKNLSILRVS